MTTFETVVERLHHEGNPYAGFQPWPESHPVKWDDAHPWFAEVIRELRPQVCVEVGTLMGNSAIHTAKLLKAEGLDAVNICVDTFCAEEFLWNLAEWRPMLKITNGRPEFYKQFMSNVMAAGQQDVIVPLPMASTSGARMLKWCGISAQLVYIDGCHEEGDAYQDLQIYWDLVLVPRGVMLIDDYNHEHPLFKGLCRDVDKFALERGLAVAKNGNKAMLRKPL